MRGLFNVSCWPVMATWGRDVATWNLPTSLDGWLSGWGTFIIWLCGPLRVIPWKTVVKAVTWAGPEKAFSAPPTQLLCKNLKEKWKHLKSRVFRKILRLHSSEWKKIGISFYCRIVFCVFFFVCVSRLSRAPVFHVPFRLTQNFRNFRHLTVI